MGIFLSIALITFVIIILIKAFSSTTGSQYKPRPIEHRGGPDPKKPRFKLLNREGDLHRDESHTYIAGVGHHCTAASIGVFFGWIENEAGNTFNPKAMAVYKDSGKKVGYIPERELANFRHWCDGKPVPCAGIIYTEGREYRGRVKALLPCNK